MSIAETQITYEEKQELGYLERLLVDRLSAATYAVLLCCTVIALGLALFHIYVAAFGTPEGRSFRSVHLSGMLILAFFSFPLFRKSVRDPVFVEGSAGNTLRLLGFAVDLVIVGLIIFIQLWTIWDIDAFHLRYGEKELPDLIVGGILIVLVLEATRRAVGWAMVLITGFFVIHSLYANYFFGFFYGPPVRFGKFIDVLFMSSDGLFGIPLHVCSTYIVLFIIFGALLIRSGAGRFFIDLAVALTGHRTGGPAKASVVASGFMGTVSGSAVANVVTTGSFTIP
ncbi:MAG: TRAP transporter large permease subunit, partial [Pseudomonadota bacterium]